MAQKTSVISGLLFGVLFLIATVIGTVVPVSDAHALCVNSRVKSWDVLWIRKGPGTRYAKRRGIPAKACGVRRNGPCSGKWCKVKYKGTTGWTNVGYLNDLDGDDSEGNGGGGSYQCKRWSQKCNNGAEWACEKYDAHDC